MSRGHPSSLQDIQAGPVMLHQHPITPSTTYELLAALLPDPELSMTDLLLPLLAFCTGVP